MGVTRRLKGIVLGALALAALLPGPAPALAGEGTNDLGWWTVPGGGGQSASATYRLSGSIGQAAAGALAGGDFMLSGGFWAAVPGNLHTLYLPVAIKH